LQKSRSYYKQKLNELQNIQQFARPEDLNNFLGVELSEELAHFLFTQVKKLQGQQIIYSEKMKSFALALYKIVGRKGFQGLKSFLPTIHSNSK
jgi:hypothetical protein